MNDEPIVDRTVCCHDRGSGGDQMSGGRLNPDSVAVFDFHHTSSRKNATAEIDNYASESVEIFQGMKLRLPWKSQYALAVNFPNRNTINMLDIAQTGAMNRFQLRF